VQENQINPSEKWKLRKLPEEDFQSRAPRPRLAEETGLPIVVLTKAGTY